MAKAQTENVHKAPTTKGLHVCLKDIVSKELARLPDLLEQLEPKERVRTILALLPYVTPKVETVATDFGEPFSIGWD
jgi:hypothetical protein